VGITFADDRIEIDRYSQAGPAAAPVAFIDTANTFRGWFATLSRADSWISYNAVDFGKTKLRSVRISASSPAGGVIQIRLDNPEGQLIAETKIPADAGLTSVDAKLSKYKKGIHNLFVVLKDDNPVNIDWIQFMKKSPDAL
jgi:hypothetical protein